MALRLGRPRASRQPNRIRPQVMTSFRWFGVQARLQAIHACLALQEAAAARLLLAEADEIRGARRGMHLSPHTVKTPTMSTYGKLEVSSRRGALERAESSGLLDPSVLRFTDGTVGIA
jgi:hypothetical protein